MRKEVVFTILFNMLTAGKCFFSSNLSIKQGTEKFIVAHTVVMDKDRAGPQVQILNWGKAQRVVGIK